MSISQLLASYPGAASLPAGAVPIIRTSVANGWATDSTSSVSIDTTGQTYKGAIAFTTNDGTTASSVADSMSNVWVEVPGFAITYTDGSFSATLRAFFCAGWADGAGSVDIVATASSAYPSLFVMLLDAGAGTLTLDKVASKTDNSNPCTSGAVTPGYVNTLAVGAIGTIAYSPVTHTPNGGFTLRSEVSNNDNYTGAMASLALSSSVATEASFTVDITPFTGVGIITLTVV